MPDDLKLDSAYLWSEHESLRQITASFLLRLPASERKHRYAFFVCKCGKVFRVAVQKVYSGRTKHCPQCTRLGINNGSYLHGGSGTLTHESYRKMLLRCGYKNFELAQDSYLDVLVCDRWLESFQNFLADMGERPSKDYSLDRIDPEGDYEPTNCRWVTKAENSRGKRRWKRG